MANPSPAASRSGLRRVLRSVAALLAGLLVTTCADNPTAPNRPGFGTVRVQPAFDQYALFAPLVLNQVRAIVVRPPADTLVDTAAAFLPSENQLTLPLRLTLHSSREMMSVTLQLLSSQQLLFSGTDSVEVRQGGSAPATSIPVTYSGPGAGAVGLRLESPDTVIRVSSTVQLSATALDAEGVGIGQFYLNWSIVGATAGATVDAAGLLHAPSAAGTVTVRGIMPNGVQSTLQLTVVPAPATLAKSSGDNQTAAPGERLTQPLAVLVTGAGSVPVPGVAVTFAATTGGGQVDSATATTNAQGIALSGVTLGATAGTQTFTVSSSGLTAVVFSATATGPGPQIRTWTGTVSTDWSVPGNWVGGTAPGITDGAIIGTATNQPSLTATTAVGSVTINSGGVLSVNGQTIVISGDLTTAGTGILRMTSSSDGVGVSGNATFGGGDESTALTGGALQISGSFTQLSTNSPNSYRATGSHTTAFAGATPSVTFASPSVAASGFQNLAWNTSGATSTMTLGSAVFAKGIFSVAGTGATGLTSTSGSRLTVMGDFAPVLPLVLNNVPLTIDQATPGTIFAGGGLTFQNMATNVSQLVIRHPGQGAPVSLAGLTFSTVPVAPNGFYLDVTDVTADATVLTVNLTGATPASGGAFVKTTGGAIVNWPLSGSTLRTWSGALNSDWTITNNWENGIAPVDGDDVLIPESATTPALFTGSITLRDLTVESESNSLMLTVNGAGGIGVTRNLIAGGKIEGTATMTLDGAGPHTVQGDIMALNVEGNTTVNSSLRVTRSLSVVSPAQATFDMSDAQVTVGQDFGTSGGGTLKMNNGSFLDVAGDVTFLGSSTAGLLVGGNINVGGDFTASASDGAYAPGNGNSVSLTGTATQTITLGSTASYFDNLAFSKGDGDVVLATDVTVFATFGGGGSDILGPHTLTASLLNASGITFDGSRLVWNSLTADPPFTFSSIRFRDYTGNPAQFTINHPGVPSNVIEFDGLTFEGTPATFHLLVNDNANDGVPLVVNLTNATPADGTGLFSATNGATVNWPASLPVWTGAVSTDWHTAGNWSTNRVPSSTDRVAISPAANQPVLGANATALSVTISGTNTQLTINGHTITVGQNLVIGSGALLVMTNTADRVIVNGDVAFAGIDPSGFLTAGELRLAGGFTQSNGNTSFRPSGSHRTVMIGTTTHQSISFCCTAGSSWFQNLDISGSYGINYQSAGNGIVIADTLISVPTDGHRPEMYGLGSAAKARHVRVNGLQVNRSPVTLDEAGQASTEQFDNVDFVSYLPTQNQFLLSMPGDGRSLTFNNLRFNAQATGSSGRYLRVTSTSAALTVNLPGATPASNGPALTTVTGAVTVNWPANDNVSWTGTVSSDWLTAGNWSTGLVPATTNDVIIPAATPNAPVLGAPGATVRSVTVNSGATLTLATGSLLAVRGNLTADGAITGPGLLQMTIENGLGETHTARGNVRTLSAFVSIDLAGALRVTDSLLYIGSSNRLALSGQALVVGGDLTTVNGGRLSMNNAADSLDVSGNLTFSGPEIAGDLTAGVMRVRGSFTQTVNGGFVASGTHRVVMSGTTAQQIQFADPTANSFNDLTIANSAAPVNILSTVVVQGMLRASSPTNELRNGDSVIVNGGVNVTGLTLTGTLLRIIATSAATPITFNNVTFTGQAPTATQLAIDHPGVAASSLTLSNLLFQATPTGAGRYVRASDNATGDGNPLVLNLTAPTPVTSGGFITTTGGATINWPTVPAAATWTGTVSTAWADPANWNGGAVPGSITAVTIPAGTPFAPTAGAVSGTSAGDLTVASGATLTLVSPFNLTVSGNIDAQGSIGPNSQTLQITGTNVTLRGTVPQINATGRVTLNGTTTTANNGATVFTGTNAELVVNGFTMTVFQLLFSNGARIQMTNPADSVLILGSTQFTGGSTEGRLTSGVLDLRGSFTQNNSGGSNASFASTGTRVRVNGATTTSFSMANGGPTESRFSNLLVNKTGGGMTLSGTVLITDSLLVSSATSITIPGSVQTGQARFLTGAGITGAGSFIVDGNRLVVATPGNYAPAITVLEGTTGTQTIPALPYQRLDLQGSAQTHVFAMARLATTGPLYVHEGNLNPAGRTVQTGAGFIVDGLGGLLMQNVLDSVLVGGNAFFQTSVDQTGNMSAGVLRIAQNMSVGPSATAFVPSGSHKTILASVATSSVNWTGLGTTPIQFQELEANANSLSMNYARVNGAMTVTGVGGINVGTLNVRGQLITSASSGMGIDSIYLGAAVPIAPGSGRVAANVFVMDGAGAQAIPTMPIPSAGQDSAVLVVRSSTSATGGLTLKGLRIDGGGQLNLNGQAVNVNGDFATADNGVLVMQNAADRLNITGATTFGGGNESSLITEGILTTSGRFTQDGTNSISSFAAVGNHQTHIATNYAGGNAVSFTTPQASAFFNLRVSVPTPFQSNVLIFNDLNIDGAGSMAAQRVAVQGNFIQTGAMTFTPKRFVYYGTLSTGITVSAGSFRPDTIQFNDGIATIPVNGNIVYNAIEATGFGEVNLGATAPAITSLLIEGTFKLNGRALNVAGPLLATGGSVVGTGSVQARRLQVTALTADNATIILNENGTSQAQQFDNVTFLNFVSPNALLLDVVAVGAAGPRAMTFTGLTYPTMPAGAGNRYIRTTSSNALPYQVTMSGSNVNAATGPNFTLANTNTSVIWP